MDTEAYTADDEIPDARVRSNYQYAFFDAIGEFSFDFPTEKQQEESTYFFHRVLYFY